MSLLQTGVKDDYIYIYIRVDFFFFFLGNIDKQLYIKKKNIDGLQKITKRTKEQQQTTRKFLSLSGSVYISIYKDVSMLLPFIMQLPVIFTCNIFLFSILFGEFF